MNSGVSKQSVKCQLENKIESSRASDTIYTDSGAL